MFTLRIKDIEDDIGVMLLEITNSMDYILLEEQEEYQVWVEPCYLHIPALQVNVVSAIGYVYSEEVGDFELETDFFIFYDNSGKELYSEGGSSLYIAAYNYCKFTGQDRSLEEVDDLSCSYVVDGGDFINEKVKNGISFEIVGEIDF